MNGKTRRSISVLVVLLLVFVATATVAAQGHGPVDNFRAHLTGGEEVPAVETNAQGQAVFQFNNDASSLNFGLIVANIEDVVAAHIHCAPAGVNGPVGVTLFSGGPTSDSGVLANGTITEPDPGNGCQWTSLGEVQAAIESGDAYVNVHTLENPGGEIRGQIH